MIQKLLKTAYEYKKIISINTNDVEWDESIIGYITEIDDVYFTMNEIDEYGIFIGNTIFAINNVIYVQPDDWYMRNLQVAHENRAVFTPNKRVTIWKTGKELISHFKSIKEDEKITRFFFEEDNFVIGLILDFDDNFLLIKNIGQDGKEEGITCYRVNDIIGLRYDGLSEQKIKLLYREKGEFCYLCP
jgi:hypothetical protein